MRSLFATLSIFAACMPVASAQAERTLRDFGGLIRYGSENTELSAPKPGEARVVFFGDEITEDWAAWWERDFSGKPYLNRGIGGQTTAQMLVRFRQDVISLKPRLVVIEGGANDLAGLTGPSTQGMMAENFMTMAELAKAHGIGVIFASVTPVCNCPGPQTRIRTPGRIFGVNGWLKDYASQTGAGYVDYHAALGGRLLKAEYTTDGFRLNENAYAVMAPLVEQAISRALGQIAPGKP